MHKLSRTIPGVVAALVLTATGCGASDGEDAADVQQLQDRIKDLEASSSAAAASASPAASAAPAEPSPKDASPSPVATVDFAMPNFVGANLQDAQNEVQELGVFFSVSHDLLGTRSQVLDSNWQVCDQTPAVGARIRGAAADYEGEIDFGVVKLTEACP